MNPPDRGFSTVRNLRLATRKGTPTTRTKSVDAIIAWLEKQDAHTRDRHFALIPYTVTKVMEVWECDLMDVKTYAKYNDNYRYTLLQMYSRNCYIWSPLRQRADLLLL